MRITQAKENECIKKKNNKTEEWPEKKDKKVKRWKRMKQESSWIIRKDYETRSKREKSCGKRKKEKEDNWRDIDKNREDVELVKNQKGKVIREKKNKKQIINQC